MNVSLATQRRRALTSAIMSLGKARSAIEYARLQVEPDPGDADALAFGRLVDQLRELAQSLDRQRADWRRMG